MYDQDWINDGYGQSFGSGVTHKVDSLPSSPICGKKASTSQMRVRWAKVNCAECLKSAPKQVREQRGISQ